MGSAVEPVPRLLQALLADPSTVTFAGATDRATAVAALAPLHAGAAELRWFGVNQRRVDAVIGVGSDEYRLVYLTADCDTVEDLVVFRRPARFHGVSGRVVVVNGPSGSGKSSVLAAIASASALPWAMFDEPVVGSVRQPYLIWRDRAPALHRGFLDAIAALASAGNLVGLSAGGHPAPVVDEVFAGLHLLRVGLDCDLPTLRARELGRDGRWGGLAEQSLADHDGWRYDVRYDTSRASPEQIAADIRRLVEPSAPSPGRGPQPR